MADSNITKKALAAALQQLMETLPFAKISVSDICERCDMNRKSFYYHFKDKYDLVNWIYYTQAILPLHEQSYEKVEDILLDICQYLYNYRDFYRKVFQISGQNSFADFFREMLEPLIIKVAERIFVNEVDQEFYMTFYAGSSITAIERWIKEKDCIPPKDFVEKSKNYLICLASKVMEYFA